MQGTNIPVKLLKANLVDTKISPLYLERMETIRKYENKFGVRDFIFLQINEKRFMRVTRHLR